MPKILFVDDDPILQQLYKTRLEKDGHEVIISSDGEEAIKILQTFKANLIILDLMMPKVNGFKFLEKAKVDNNAKDIPVIVFSSLIRPEQAEYLKKLGVVDTINKIDVTPTQLVEVINNLTKK
jgi:CheY-like chemotaxis protein